jgi:alcohol dehydrogenase YqhD (iron-dependent ADH family)
MRSSVPFKFNLARLPRIEFGAGRLAALPGLVAGYGRRVLIVTGGRSFLAGPHWKPWRTG